MKHKGIMVNKTPETKNLTEILWDKIEKLEEDIKQLKDFINFKPNNCKKCGEN